MISGYLVFSNANRMAAFNRLAPSFFFSENVWRNYIRFLRIFNLIFVYELFFCRCSSPKRRHESAWLKFSPVWNVLWKKDFLTFQFIGRKQSRLLIFHFEILGKPKESLRQRKSSIQLTCLIKDYPLWTLGRWMFLKYFMLIVLDCAKRDWFPFCLYCENLIRKPQEVCWKSARFQEKLLAFTDNPFWECRL